MTDNFSEAETSPGWPDPHAADPHEDPEQHLGEVLPDPWDDPGQKDWETHSVSLDPRTMGV